MLGDEAWYLEKIASHETASFTASKLHVLRLRPNEDLLQSLWRYARVTNTKALSIVSAVGSLTTTNIRYANDENGTSLTGHFEIVSLVGNIDLQDTDKLTTQYSSELIALDRKGSGHVHISVSDEQGQTIGGHLLSGNVIYTTAEITLVEMPFGRFARELDDGPKGSGYYELKVYHDV